MKKMMLVLTALVLAVALSGCGAKDETKASPSPAPNGVFTPLTPGDDNLDDSLAAPASSPVAMQTPPPAADPEPLQNDLTALDGEPDALPDALDAGPDEDPLAAPSPSPTSAPGPVTQVALKDYVYETYTDENLGLSIGYPSHWTVENGSNTISFVEPVASGIPMRLALSVKRYEDKLSVEQQKSEFTDYVNAIKGGYSNFSKGKVNNKIAFMSRAAWNCQYKAKQSGSIVRGYVIMTKVEQSKQIVALHFSAPKNKYTKETRAMFKKVMYSVKRLTDSAATA